MKSTIKNNHLIGTYIMLIALLVSNLFLPVTAFSAETKTQQVTIHKKALTEAEKPEAPIENDGNEIVGFPGSPLPNVIFTAYDVTADYVDLRTAGSTVDEAYLALKTLNVAGHIGVAFPATDALGLASLTLSTETVVSGKNVNAVYLLVETSAPSNVTKADNMVIGLPFYDSETNARLSTVHLYPKDYQVTEEYQFTKYGVAADGTQKTPLAGAQFVLKNGQGMYLKNAPLPSGLPDFSITSITDAAIQKYTSDVNGLVKTGSIALEAGTYTFEEILTVEPYHMTANANQAVQLVVTPMGGSYYKYFDINGLLVDDSSTAEVYNYKIPLPEKTVDDDDIDFDQVLNYTAKINIPLDPTSYSKFDLVDLPDADLNLLSNLATLKAVIKAPGGDIILATTPIAVGTNGFRFSFYSNVADKALIEANAGNIIQIDFQMNIKEGAVIDEDIINELVFENTLKKETLPNDPRDEEIVKTHGKKFIKTDVYNPELGLEGAEFLVLKYVAGTPQYRTFDGLITYGWTADREASNLLVLTSDDQGEFEVRGLETGSYQLEEVKAPEGYQLPETAFFDFDITETSYSNSEEILEVFNSENGILPRTGGNGILYFLTFGLAMMLGGFLYFQRRKKAVN